MAAKKKTPKTTSKSQKNVKDVFWGKFKWPLLGLFFLSSFITLTLMIFLCKQLFMDKSKPHIEKPLEHLGKRLEEVLKDPGLKLNTPKKTAEEAIKLPAYIKHADKKLQDHRKSYYALFQKTAKAANGWNLSGMNLYYISKGKKTWYDAENFCVSRESHLASILSDEEQNYLNTQLSEPSWIGLSTANKGDNWEWSDGSKLITEYWSHHPRPSKVSRKGDRGCTLINPSMGSRNWIYANCHEPRNWVCKESLAVGKK
ncbi:C-type lectin domain family 4 member K-like isoform X2 [Pantherophis guttatus]|nr:C-type lectin domain family 4 member K-like isoform X2 [Pantherophis guttatus]